MTLELKDNSISGVFKQSDIAALYPIADKTVKKLCHDNDNLLIFPHKIEETEDKIGEYTILTFRTTDNPEQVCIATGNIMGFIGLGDLQVKIKSRFDDGRDDFLLHYMLQRVLSLNLFDLSHNNDKEDVFDFIMLMFPFLLKNAMRQGIYREYQHFRHNDVNVKGPIDVARHIERNIPFVGNVAYSTREYSCDNSMTQLIRHTIEFMRTKKYGQAVLDIDRETIENVSAILEHTSSYNKNLRSSVISKNLRMKTHPYYTEYRPLQSLCLQILRMEEMKYGNSDEEISGILFDGSWLWEEYVNVLLQEHNMGFKHAKNRSGEGGFYLFESHSRKLLPDFYKDDFVIDAKYKRLGSYEKVADVSREDLYQVITYMHRLQASKGGFVAPLEKRIETNPTQKMIGRNEWMSIFGIEISKSASSYSDFCEQMKHNEVAFAQSLHDFMLYDNPILSLYNKNRITYGQATTERKRSKGYRTGRGILQ